MTRRTVRVIAVLMCAGSMIASGASALESEQTVETSDASTTNSASVGQPRAGDAPSDGTVAPAIVGGSPITITAAPWQVLLAYVDAPSYWQFCGGSIIDPLWIVTAAHCVDDPTEWTYIQVASGVTDKSSLSLADFVDVVQVYVHERWNSSTDENDIALLRLASPLDLTGSSRKAIALPTSVAATWPSNGTSGFITGWGHLSSGGSSPDQLHGATLQVLAGVGSPTCGFYGGDYKPTSMLCAGVPAGGVDTCQGDSGGPLAISDGGQWILAGITSWGNGCAMINYPGIYTRVTSYVQWIRSKIPPPPGAPTIRRVTPGDSQVAIAYRAPSSTRGAPITGYEYSLDGGAWSAVASVTRTTLTVTGLVNGVTRNLAIRAVNASGPGATSSAVSITPRRAPDAPTITSITRGDRTISVYFSPPGFDGGAPITTYEYSLNGGRWMARRPASPSSPILIGRLTNSSSYSVRIRAVNAAGRGTESSSVLVGP